MSRVVDLNTKRDVPASNGPGEGGGNMESRVKHLEDDMREMRTDVKAIRHDVAELKGKVSMLPGYPGIALIVGLIATAMTVAIKFIPSAALP